MEHKSKPIYKRFWFWLAMIPALFVLSAIVSTFSLIIKNLNGGTAVVSSNTTTATNTSSHTSPQPKPTVKSQDTIEKEKADEVKQFLKENFGDTSWGRAITDIKVHGDAVDVYTNIYPDAEGKAIAKQIVGPIFGNIRASLFEPSSVTIWCKDDPAATKYA